MNRSAETHSHRKETIFSYYLYLAGKFLAEHLSLELSNYLSTLNARYFRATHANEKNAVINNLSIISQFNNGISYSSLEPFIAFSQTVAEFLAMAAGKPDALIESVSVVGEHHINQNQRGVIYLSAHSGNWELSAAKLVAMGHPLMVIVQPHPNPLINNLFNKTRLKLGIKIYTIGQNPITLFKHLNSGGHLAVLGDRDFTGHGEVVDMLGASAVLPTGYFKLARATNSIIVPSQHLRQSGDLHSQLIFSNPIDLCNNEIATEQLCFKHIEDIIASRPECWTVFEPVLKKERPVE